MYYVRNLIRMFLTHLHLTHQSISSEELFDVQGDYRDIFSFQQGFVLRNKEVAAFLHAKNKWTWTPERLNFVSSRFYIQKKQFEKWAFSFKFFKGGVGESLQMDAWDFMQVSSSAVGRHP